MALYIKKSTLFVAILLTLMGCGSETGSYNSNQESKDKQESKDFLTWTEIYKELQKGSIGVLEVVGYHRDDNPLTSISEKQIEILRSINFDSLDQIFLTSAFKDTLAKSQYTTERSYYVYHDSIPYTGYYFDDYGRVKSTLWGMPYKIKADLVEYDDFSESYKSCAENSIPTKLHSRHLGSFKFGTEIIYNLFECNGNRIYKNSRNGSQDPCSGSRKSNYKITITEHDVLGYRDIGLEITDSLVEKLKSINYLVGQKNITNTQLIENRDHNAIMKVSNILSERHGPRYTIWKRDTVQYENYYLGDLHGTFYVKIDLNNSEDYWEKCEFDHGERVYHVGPAIQYYGKDPTAVKGDTNFYNSSYGTPHQGYCSKEGTGYTVYNYGKNRFYDPQSNTYGKKDEIVRQGDFRSYRYGKLKKYILYDAGREMLKEEYKGDYVYAYQKSRWVWDESLKDSIHVVEEDYYKFSPNKWDINDRHYKYNEKKERIYKRVGEDVFQYEYDNDGNIIKETKNGKRVG